MSDPSTPPPPPDVTCAELLDELRALGGEENREGMGRFGIDVTKALGVSVTTLRGVARATLKGWREERPWRHAVAECLWQSDIHEARMLATMIDDPSLVTPQQAEAWAADSTSWDLTDGLCMNLLDRTSFAYEIAEEWSSREETFVKRAAFALMAVLSWHDKEAADSRFLPFLPLIRREAHDERNFVKKAVNWALRQIGKRSAELHAPCLALAEELAESDDRAERWVGRDAVRELSSNKVLQRMGLA